MKIESGTPTPAPPTPEGRTDVKVEIVMKILGDDFTRYLVGKESPQGYLLDFVEYFSFFTTTIFLTSSVLLKSILSPNLECIERPFWHNCQLFNWALSYFVWTDLVVQTSFDVLHLPKFILYVGSTIIFVMYSQCTSKCKNAFLTRLDNIRSKTLNLMI